MNKKEFNRIQAWGIFRGLGKFFSAGFPQISLLKESCSFNDSGLHLELELRDDDGIDPKSVEVYFDSTSVEHSFDLLTNTLTIDLKDVPSGDHELRVICADKRGVHSLPYYSKIITE